MSDIASGGVAVLLAYLAGSIPFGLLTARLVAGVDIRTRGSGNIGATNVGRVLGTKWGLFVLALDALKGLLPVWLLPNLFVADECPHLRVACGIATIVGHMFPCWLGFRGGKGVATSLGVVLVIAPWATAAAFAVFAVSFAAFRIVALSSILAAVSYGATQMASLWPAPFSQETWSLAAFGLAVPLLIIIRHRSNIGRLWRGEEPQFRSGAAKSGPILSEEDASCESAIARGDGGSRHGSGESLEP